LAITHYFIYNLINATLYTGLELLYL